MKTLRDNKGAALKKSCRRLCDEKYDIGSDEWLTCRQECAKKGKV